MSIHLRRCTTTIRYHRRFFTGRLRARLACGAQLDSVTSITTAMIRVCCCLYDYARAWMGIEQPLTFFSGRYITSSTVATDQFRSPGGWNGRCLRCFGVEPRRRQANSTAMPDPRLRRAGALPTDNLRVPARDRRMATPRRRQFGSSGRLPIILTTSPPDATPSTPPSASPPPPSATTAHAHAARSSRGRSRSLP